MTQAAAEKNPTDVVLDVCKAIATGDKTRAGELNTLVEKRQREINYGYAGFVKALEAKGDSFEQLMAMEIAAVEHFFGLYHDALKKLGTYASDPKDEVLKEGAYALGSAAVGLRYAMKVYDDKFLAQGTSRYALVNYFTNLSKHILVEQKPEALWDYACDSNIAFFEKALDQIDKSPNKNKPHVPERQAALAQILEVIKKMKVEGPQEERKGGVMTLLETDDSLITQLSEALGSLKEAVDAFDVHELASGPTASPRANMVVNATTELLAGRIPASVHKSIVAAYLQVIQKSLADLMVTARRPNESEIMAEELAKLVEATEGLEEAVAALAPLSEGTKIESAELEKIVDQIKAHIETADSSTKKIASINEEANKIHCPACNFANPQGILTCQKCHIALPSSEKRVESSTYQYRESTGSSFDEPIMTKKIKELFDACEAFDSGKISAKELTVQLDKSEDDLDKARATVSQLKLPTLPDDIPEEHLAFAKEAIELGVEGVADVANGITECFKGIDMLRNCLESHTRAQLEDGMRTYFLGCQHMLKIAKPISLFLNLGIEKIRETAPELLVSTPPPAEVTHTTAEPRIGGDHITMEEE